MNLNFIWLEDFLALAATGNFSRAAEERHSSQPAFSRRIRALEEWLGTPLVDRSSQPARLTEAGEWFKTAAQDLLARAARLPGEAQQLAEASQATLRIASTHALSFTFLPRWLLGLESRLTLGPVQLVSDVMARCEVLMQQGKAHFLVSHAHPKVGGGLSSADYLGATIGADELIPVSAPDAQGQAMHPLGGAAHVPVALLAYTDESGLGRIVQSVLGPALESWPVQVVLTAHLASVLRSMALEGRGLAWLPRSLVVDDLALGRLVPAASDDWHIALDIRLHRARDRVGHAAEAFWRAATEATVTGDGGR